MAGGGHRRGEGTTYLYRTSGWYRAFAAHAIPEREQASACAEGTFYYLHFLPTPLSYHYGQS